MGSKATLKTTHKDMGLKSILAALKRAHGLEFTAGFDGPLAERAAANEFGTDDRPPEGFMKAAFAEGREGYKKKLKEAVVARSKGQHGAIQAGLKEAAEQAKADIQHQIEAKGLIDTGAMHAGVKVTREG